jgi:hypothetical protein
MRQLYEAYALTPPFATVRRNEWFPLARFGYDVGELQATAAAPSSEHLTLVELPVINQANVAVFSVVTDAGFVVSTTFGAVPPPVEPLPTVHAYEDVRVPYEFETVTVNRWAPAARPE